MNGRESFDRHPQNDCPMTVYWCSDYPGDQRVALSTETQLSSRDFAGGENQPDEMVGIVATKHLDVGELDRLISTLQRARRDVFGDGPAVAVTLEVVERGRASDNTTAGSIIVPNEVRINGQPVLTRGGVRLHDATYGKRGEIAEVTMTLPVRMLTVAAEHDIHPAEDGQAGTVRP